MAYNVIYNRHEKGFWSNDGGWVEFEDATSFTDEEVGSANLPLDGFWMKVCLMGIQMQRKKIEDVQITVKKYYTPDGKHTCSVDYPEREICQFLGTRRCGTTYVCMCNGDDLMRYDDNPLGFLEPHRYCILREGKHGTGT